MGKPAQTHMNEVFFLRFPSGRWVQFLSRALKSQQSCFSPVRKALSDPHLGLPVLYEHMVPTVIYLSVLFQVTELSRDGFLPTRLSTLPGFSESIS